MHYKQEQIHKTGNIEIAKAKILHSTETMIN